jgi:hypothetical protein
LIFHVYIPRLHPLRLSALDEWLQMTGGSDAVVFGRCDPATWHPDLDWLEGELSGPSPPRMVVLINPCNPTGECRHCLLYLVNLPKW